MIKQARKSGQLNLSNRGMINVPDRVWTILELDQEETKAAGQRSMDNNEENWWDMVDLTKLILACNKISTISDKVRQDRVAIVETNLPLFQDFKPRVSADIRPA